MQIPNKPSKPQIKEYLKIVRVIPHSFQPSFFSKTGSVSLGLRRFSRKILIPGKNGKVALDKYAMQTQEHAQKTQDGAIGESTSGFGLGELTYPSR